MTSRVFIPWLRQLLGGMACVAIGAGLAYQARLQHPNIALAGVGLILVGVALVNRAKARERGQRIERRAIEKLSLPDGWTIHPNVILRTGGDLDLLLKRDDGTRYAVEIKSYDGVLLKRNLFGVSESLVRLNGARIDHDPVPQVLLAAETTDATPVLWLPAAKSTKTFRMRCGVIVVQGSHRQLKHAIGAKKWWQW